MYFKSSHKTYSSPPLIQLNNEPLSVTRTIKYLDEHLMFKPHIENLVKQLNKKLCLQENLDISYAYCLNYIFKCYNPIHTIILSTNLVFCLKKHTRPNFSSL